MQKMSKRGQKQYGLKCKVYFWQNIPLSAIKNILFLARTRAKL